MNKHKIKIAIVDDAPFIREILRNIIILQGWQVVGEAENGHEAIQMALISKPHLILMDIVMPQVNGIEAAKKILQNNPLIKIIACSTLDQENILLNAIEIGCCSYITKPFKKDEVIKAINQAFELIKEVS
jgi:two-component system chemotaxis response regulator CheY